MVATLYAMTGALFLLQNGPDWQLAPRLLRGQELVYRGTFTEESLARGVQFNRAYRLETRLFVLDAAPQVTEVALFTVLKIRGRPEPNEAAQPSSVRLERVRLDLHGRARTDSHDSLAIPLDAPPTIESGLFVEIPRGRAGLNQSWTVVEEGRPAQTWKVIGSEVLNGVPCLRLDGIQQSDDWDRPRADRTAWRRSDKVWLAARLGVAYRVERTIEHRDPARLEPTQRSVVRYEQESDLRYPEQHADDRRREILAALNLGDAVAPLLPEPTRHGRQPFDALLSRIARHIDQQPPTPYREAILHLQRRVEDALQGKTPPSLVQASTPITSRLTLGRQAPEFTLIDLIGRQAVSLRQRLGKPVLLAFFRPKSASAPEVLRFAQRIRDTLTGKIEVVALAEPADEAAIQRLHAELRLTVPIVSAEKLRTSYVVEETPKLVVIDAHGFARADFVGWGKETSIAVDEELRKWLLEAEAVRPVDKQTVPGILLKRPKPAPSP